MEFVRVLYDDANQLYDNASRVANQMSERLTGADNDDETNIIPAVFKIAKDVSKKCGRAARYGRSQSIHTFKMIAGSEDNPGTENPEPKPRGGKPVGDGVSNPPARPDASYTITTDNRVQELPRSENESERVVRDYQSPMMTTPLSGPQSEFQHPAYSPQQQQQQQQQQIPPLPWLPGLPPAMPQIQPQQQQMPPPPNWPQMFPRPTPQPQNQPPPRPPFLPSFFPFSLPGMNRNAPQIPPPPPPPPPPHQLMPQQLPYQMYNLQPPPPVKVDRQVQHPSNDTLYSKRSKNYKQPCSSLYTTIVRDDDPCQSDSIQHNWCIEDVNTPDCLPCITDCSRTCRPLRRRSRSARSARNTSLVSKCCVEKAVYRKLLQLMAYPDITNKCVNNLKNDDRIDASGCRSCRSPGERQRTEIKQLDCYQKTEPMNAENKCPLIYSCPWAKLVSKLQQHICAADKTGNTWVEQCAPDTENVKFELSEPEPKHDIKCFKTIGTQSPDCNRSEMCCIRESLEIGRPVECDHGCVEEIKTREYKTIQFSIKKKKKKKSKPICLNVNIRKLLKALNPDPTNKDQKEERPFHSTNRDSCVGPCWEADCYGGVDQKQPVPLSEYKDKLGGLCKSVIDTQPCRNVDEKPNKMNDDIAKTRGEFVEEKQKILGERQPVGCGCGPKDVKNVLHNSVKCGEILNRASNVHENTKQVNLRNRSEIVNSTTPRDKQYSERFTKVLCRNYNEPKSSSTSKNYKSQNKVKPLAITSQCCSSPVINSRLYHENRLEEAKKSLHHLNDTIEQTKNRMKSELKRSQRIRRQRNDSLVRELNSMKHNKTDREGDECSGNWQKQRRNFQNKTVESFLHTLENGMKTRKRNSSHFTKCNIKLDYSNQFMKNAGRDTKHPCIANQTHEDAKEFCQQTTVVFPTEEKQDVDPATMPIQRNHFVEYDRQQSNPRGVEANPKYSNIKDTPGTSKSFKHLDENESRMKSTFSDKSDNHYCNSDISSDEPQTSTLLTSVELSSSSTRIKDTVGVSKDVSEKLRENKEIAGNLISESSKQTTPKETTPDVDGSERISRVSEGVTMSDKVTADISTANPGIVYHKNERENNDSDTSSVSNDDPNSFYCGTHQVVNDDLKMKLDDKDTNDDVNGVDTDNVTLSRSTSCDVASLSMSFEDMVGKNMKSSFDKIENEETYRKTRGKSLRSELCGYKFSTSTRKIVLDQIIDYDKCIAHDFNEREINKDDSAICRANQKLEDTALSKFSNKVYYGDVELKTVGPQACSDAGKNGKDDVENKTTNVENSIEYKALVLSKIKGRLSSLRDNNEYTSTQDEVSVERGIKKTRMSCRSDNRESPYKIPCRECPNNLIGKTLANIDCESDASTKHFDVSVSLGPCSFGRGQTSDDPTSQPVSVTNDTNQLQQMPCSKRTRTKYATRPCFTCPRLYVERNPFEGKENAENDEISKPVIPDERVGLCQSETFDEKSACKSDVKKGFHEHGHFECNVIPENRCPNQPDVENFEKSPKSKRSVTASEINYNTIVEEQINGCRSPSKEGGPNAMGEIAPSTVPSPSHIDDKCCRDTGVSERSGKTNSCFVVKDYETAGMICTSSEHHSWSCASVKDPCCDKKKLSSKCLQSPYKTPCRECTRCYPEDALANVELYSSNKHTNLITVSECSKPCDECSLRDKKVADDLSLPIKYLMNEDTDNNSHRHQKYSHQNSHTKSSNKPCFSCPNNKPENDTCGEGTQNDRILEQSNREECEKRRFGKKKVHPENVRQKNCNWLGKVASNPIYAGKSKVKHSKKSRGPHCTSSTRTVATNGISGNTTVKGRSNIFIRQNSKESLDKNIDDGFPPLPPSVNNDKRHRKIEVSKVPNDTNTGLSESDFDTACHPLISSITDKDRKWSRISVEDLELSDASDSLNIDDTIPESLNKELNETWVSWECIEKQAKTKERESPRAIEVIQAHHDLNKKRDACREKTECIGQKHTPKTDCMPETERSCDRKKSCPVLNQSPYKIPCRDCIGSCSKKSVESTPYYRGHVSPSKCLKPFCSRSSSRDGHTSDDGSSSDKQVIVKDFSNTNPPSKHRCPITKLYDNAGSSQPSGIVEFGIKLFEEKKKCENNRIIKCPQRDVSVDPCQYKLVNDGTFYMHVDKKINCSKVQDKSDSTCEKTGTNLIDIRGTDDAKTFNERPNYRRFTPRRKLKTAYQIYSDKLAKIQNDALESEAGLNKGIADDSSFHTNASPPLIAGIDEVKSVGENNAYLTKDFRNTRSSTTFVKENKKPVPPEHSVGDDITLSTLTLSSDTFNVPEIKDTPTTSTKKSSFRKDNKNQYDIEVENWSAVSSGSTHHNLANATACQGQKHKSKCMAVKDSCNDKKDSSFSGCKSPYETPCRECTRVCPEKHSAITQSKSDTSTKDQRVRQPISECSKPCKKCCCVSVKDSCPGNKDSSAACCTSPYKTPCKECTRGCPEKHPATKRCRSSTSTKRPSVNQPTSECSKPCGKCFWVSLEDSCAGNKESPSHCGKSADETPCEECTWNCQEKHQVTTYCKSNTSTKHQGEHWTLPECSKPCDKCCYSQDGHMLDDVPSHAKCDINADIDNNPKDKSCVPCPDRNAGKNSCERKKECGNVRLKRIKREGCVAVNKCDMTRENSVCADHQEKPSFHSGNKEDTDIQEKMPQIPKEKKCRKVMSFITNQNKTVLCRQCGGSSCGNCNRCRDRCVPLCTCLCRRKQIQTCCQLFAEHRRPKEPINVCTEKPLYDVVCCEGSTTPTSQYPGCTGSTLGVCDELEWSQHPRRSNSVASFSCCCHSPVYLEENCFCENCECPKCPPNPKRFSNTKALFKSIKQRCHVLRNVLTSSALQIRSKAIKKKAKSVLKFSVKKKLKKTPKKVC